MKPEPRPRRRKIPLGAEAVPLVNLLVEVAARNKARRDAESAAARERETQITA